MVDNLVLILIILTMQVSCLKCRNVLGGVGGLNFHLCMSPIEQWAHKYIRLKKTRLKHNKGNVHQILLTKEELIEKLHEAGIGPDDIGIGKGKYALGRRDHDRDYTYDNCDFIPNEENSKEMHTRYTKEDRKQWAKVWKDNRAMGLHKVPEYDHDCC